MTDTLRAIHAASDALVERMGGRKPQIGIVLGSGLGMLADQIENPLVIPYSELPGFPVSTAIGHKGNFIVGTPGPWTHGPPGPDAPFHRTRSPSPG